MRALGQSAETAAGKIRYQMGRLRSLAANFELQREASLTRHAEAISQALYPGGGLQSGCTARRTILPAMAFGAGGRDHRAGREPQPGHTVLWL